MTIATAVTTALVGITGTVTAAVVSYKTSARQVATENERSVAEFLRTQRQTAYAAFSDQVITTFNSLLIVMGLFMPDRPPPNPSEYYTDSTAFFSDYRKLGTAYLHIQLVASGPVRSAAADVFHKFNDCNTRVIAGGAYVYGRKPVDDSYKTIPLTDSEGKEFDSLNYAFLKAGHDELESMGIY